MTGSSTDRACPALLLNGLLLTDMVHQYSSSSTNCRTLSRCSSVSRSSQLSITCAKYLYVWIRVPVLQLSIRILRKHTRWSSTSNLGRVLSRLSVSFSLRPRSCSTGLQYCIWTGRGMSSRRALTLQNPIIFWTFARLAVPEYSFK